MHQRFRAMRANESGFTLVELLIVIVILGILTGIVVFAVGGFSDRGDVAACKSDKKVVEVAVEAYRAKNSTYPTGANSGERFDKLLGITPAGSPAYLREAPSSTKYTITITDDNGSVVSAGVC